MKWIGVDESGKGDYFGYLVIAGVVADEDTAEKLRSIGVKDSKKLSDPNVQKIAAVVKKTCSHDIIRISPEKYNQLYKKFRNLNKLLAWGHARVIENLMRDDIDHVVVDKFADEKVLNKMLFEKSRKKKLIQEIRGERDIAVAAASVLARSEFLKTLRSLSLQVGVSLPKGSTHVSEAIKEILAKYDENVLQLVAKTHFKITKRVVKV